MSCLKGLKYTMCVVNFIFFICGVAVFALGIYLMTSYNLSSLLASIHAVNIASTLFVTGIIITCVSFLGFLGALKEKRCLLISFFILMFILMLVELGTACILLLYETDIDQFIEKDLIKGLEKYKDRGQNATTENDWDTLQTTFKCCGVKNVTDWKDSVPPSCCTEDPCPENKIKYWNQGCYDKLKKVFDSNLLNVGIGVIVICIIEVLGMCFSMTLFCHINRSGLKYK
ncbi:leukocyte surface antigen CD53-like [Xyrauchen texanus]|uniref:leukocyte surface antigen CD53-like n=1 Tax=Xyrauchen texanus TaxID=154827 RepID=UPI002241BCF0|nr:leukocyte surface antigen CD53-like [Xyrauchen texanus]